jgi:protein-tyrosine phosphatase
VGATIENAELEPDDDGCLLVRWQLSEPAAVHISVGSSPATIEHRPVLQVAAGSGSARLSGLSPGRRHYVSVAPLGGTTAVVVGERRMPFQGAGNFRDLGGYPTRHGTRTRWGHVFRSDGLHRLTPADLEMFDRLGIRAVYDLRGSTERAVCPDLVESVPIGLLDWYTGSEGPSLLTATCARDGEKVLNWLYVGMLKHAARLFGELISSLTSPRGLPAVFHCAGGKDRTGMAAALLLGALEVDRATVLDDYQLTGHWQSIDRSAAPLGTMVSAGICEDAAEAFLGTPRWAMADALEWLDNTYGSTEAYLIGPCGMEEPQLHQLRRVLAE